MRGTLWGTICNFLTNTYLICTGYLVMAPTIRDVVKYIEDNQINPTDALNILKKSTEINPNNKRSVWKAIRMNLYIQQRYDEYKQGMLGKKTDSVRRVLDKPDFIKLADKFNTGRFDKGREFKLLNHLITDPRQSSFFRVKNFKIKGNLSQKILDEIR